MTLIILLIRAGYLLRAYVLRKEQNNFSNVVIHAAMALDIRHLQVYTMYFKISVIFTPNEPRHDISNNVVCATSKGSDQPSHTRSLIRAFASLPLTDHHLEF